MFHLLQMFTDGPVCQLDEFTNGQSKSLGELIPSHLLLQVTLYNPELISHGPIFNMSDTFIGVWSQTGVGGCESYLTGQQNSQDQSLLS